MPPVAVPRPSRATTIRQRAWKVAEAVVGPVLPAGTLDLLSPLRAGADLRGRIVAVQPETADAATLTIQPGQDWAGHLPGQYIRLGIDVDGVRHWRAYSLTSRTDRTDGLITITPKAIPDGLVSNHLNRAVTPGTMVMLDQATGDFVMSTPRPAKVLFLTGGSGITPVMGMLRNHPDLADVVLLHSAPRREDVVFGTELRELAATGKIRLVERHTDAEGMLELTELDRIVPDWRERETWACGPTGMLDACEQHWDTAGLADLLHTERFRPAVFVTGEGGTLTFTVSGRTVEADGGTPILDVAEDAGVLMPSGCRMGICFRCVLPLREGVVRDLRNGELTYAAAGDGVRIQTCVSAAAGPCEIEH